MRIRSCRFRLASSMTSATKREGKVIGAAGAPLADSKLPSAAVPCATLAASDAGVSTEKCEITCGLPSWRISKSASRRSPTALPCESWTMTRTGTRLTCDSRGTCTVRVVISAIGSAAGVAAEVAPEVAAGTPAGVGNAADDESVAGGAPDVPGAEDAEGALSPGAADEVTVPAFAGPEFVAALVVAAVGAVEVALAAEAAGAAFALGAGAGGVAADGAACGEAPDGGVAGDGEFAGGALGAGTFFGGVAG